MNERVAKLEAVLPFLATKADIADLRGEVHKASTDVTRWTFGTVLAIVGVATTVLIFFINRAVPIASEPRPIVIQVPASTAPAQATPLPSK